MKAYAAVEDHFKRSPFPLVQSCRSSRLINTHLTGSLPGGAPLQPGGTGYLPVRLRLKLCKPCMITVMHPEVFIILQLLGLCLTKTMRSMQFIEDPTVPSQQKTCTPPPPVGISSGSTNQREHGRWRREEREAPPA